MQTRRIALVGPAWPYRGGIAHFVASMARALATRGHAVQTVTFRRQYPDALFPGRTQFDDGPPPAGAPVADRWIDSLSPLSWSRAARRIADGGADLAVVHTFMPFLAPSLGRVARGLRRRGVRTLGVVHNALPHERRPGDRALTRYVLRSFDALVVMSDVVEADVHALGVRVPITRVPHPTYDLFGAPVPRAEARAALGLPPDAPVFLFFGFIRRYKGLHVLLDAMRAVRERVPEARLVVAGEFYADEAALRAQAAPLGEAVRFDAAYIPDETVARYVCAADAVVQPYVSATQSGVAQIAFHFGRPVITTDVGGLAASVPDGVAGLVVPPEQPDALADAMVRFVRDGLAERLEAGARAERDRTSWDRFCEVVEALADDGP
jgi:glycosyltransferase involved in cell wall biosynthesis